MSPSTYIPRIPADFIGPARTAAKLRFFQAGRFRGTRVGNFRLTLYGPPGTAKTRLANALALHLCGTADGIRNGLVRSKNGQSVSTEQVREWTESAHYLPISTADNPVPRAVYIVNECDAMSTGALNEWRSFSDDLKDGNDLILTTNKDLTELQPQLQTRGEASHIGAPPESEKAAWLFEKFGVDATAAREIARKCGGCVRAALLDAQTHLDTLAVEALG